MKLALVTHLLDQVVIAAVMHRQRARNTASSNAAATRGASAAIDRRLQHLRLSDIALLQTSHMHFDESVAAIRCARNTFDERGERYARGVLRRLYQRIEQPIEWLLREVELLTLGRMNDDLRREGHGDIGVESEPRSYRCVSTHR